MREKLYLMLGFIAIVGIVFLFTYLSDKKVRKNHEVVSAIVTEVDGLNKAASSVFVKYFYFAEGSKYENREAFSCDRNLAGAVSDLIYRNPQIRVVYEKSNPSNSRILLSWRLYKYYNIEPDSNISPLLDSLGKLCGY